MKQVLFICTGNTCRSPLAAALFNRLVRLWRIPGIVVKSAGLTAFPGDPASVPAIEAGRELGVDLSRHRARPVTRELLMQSDWLVAMTQAHAAALCRIAPPERVLVLGGGIDDPFGGDLPAYRRTAERMIAGFQPLLARLTEETDDA